MGEQHFAHVAVDFLLSPAGGEGHVFEGQAGKLARPGFLCLNGAQGREGPDQAVSAGPGQRVAVAGGAGGGVAFAAGGQYHATAFYDLTIFQLHAAGMAVPGENFGHPGKEADLRAQGAELPLKGAGHVAGVVGDGEHPPAPFGLEGHAPAFQQGHEVLIAQPGEAGVEEAGVPQDIGEKGVPIGGVGYVAAPLAGDPQFFQRPVPRLYYHGVRSELRRGYRGHKSRGASARRRDISRQLFHRPRKRPTSAQARRRYPTAFRPSACRRLL